MAAHPWAARRLFFSNLLDEKFSCPTYSLSRVFRGVRVTRMSLARFALSFVLTLSLAGAPVAQALAMAVASAPDSISAHAGHESAQHDEAAHLQHDSHNEACAQHDLCDGSCCAACAQCVNGVTLFLFYTDVFHPVLTPSIYRLAFRTLVALRERPPRSFSL